MGVQGRDRLGGEVDRVGVPLYDDDRRMLGRSLAGEALAAEASARLARGEPLLSAEEEDRLAAEVVAEVVGLAGLEEYLADPAVTDIDCNGPAAVHVTYADGRRERRPPLFSGPDELAQQIRMLARAAGVPADGATVELDA